MNKPIEDIITIKVNPKFYMSTERIAELLEGYLRELGLDVKCIAFDIAKGEETVSIDCIYEQSSKSFILKESKKLLDRLLIDYKILEIS